MRHSYLVIGGHTFRLKVEPSTISFLLLVVELSEGYLSELESLKNNVLHGMQRLRILILGP